MLVQRLLFNCMCRRTVSTLYLPENVLCQENKEKTSTQFLNMPPVRKQSHLPQRKAAVLIPLCITDGKVSLLYTLRNSNLRRHRGQVSFPGGMQDESDQNIIDTALRETQEELGIDPKSVEVWGTGKELLGKGKTTITPVIGHIKEHYDIKDLKLNKDEVEEAFYVNLEELCNPKMIRYTHFKNAQICMPVYTGGKMRIWGLTGIMTHMLLRCLLPPTAYHYQIKTIHPITSSNQSNGT